MNTQLKIATVSFALTGLGYFAAAHAADEPFQASMSLLAPVAITETQALSFPNAASGTATTVVVAPADATAATFTATGEASTAVTGSVVEASITMITGGGGTAQQQIVVNTFTTGGDMNGAGAATFSGAGSLANLRIGATANISADDVAGAYAGTATFRLVYQ